MKWIIVLLPILIGSIYKSDAQNVGIGTIPSASSKLYIKANIPEILRLEGSSPYLSFFRENPAVYSGYLWHEGSGMRLGSAENLPVFLYANYSGGSLPITILPNGNVGIANTNPVYKLDVPGPVRIRHDQSTPGFWFNNSTNTYSPGFIGVYNDNYLGFYASAFGAWSLRMNIGNGHVGIGTDTDIATVKIDAPNGNALEVSGGIKVSGSVRPAFRVIATTANLYDLDFRGNFRSIIIDHPLCNGIPTALLFATPLISPNQAPCQVIYDNTIGKWKINLSIQTGARPTGFSVINYLNNADQCLSTGPVITFETDVRFSEGDTFNVLVINR